MFAIRPPSPIRPLSPTPDSAVISSVSSLPSPPEEKASFLEKHTQDPAPLIDQEASSSLRPSEVQIPSNSNLSESGYLRVALADAMLTNETLQECREKVNCKDSQGNTQLHSAVQQKLGKIRDLLEASANPFLENKAGATSKEITSKKKQATDTILTLLSTLSESPEEAEKYAVLCFDGTELRRVPGINEQYSAGNTLLHLAIKHEHSDEIIDALLRAGADPHLRNNNGDNSIDLAIELKRDQYVILALQLAGKSKIKSSADKTIMEEIKQKHSSRENLTYMKIRQDLGECKEYEYEEDQSPLHFAFANSKDLKEIEGLLKRITDKEAINARYRKGNTLLHFLMKKGGSLENIQLLLKAGANVSQVNDEDQSPLHLLSKTVDSLIIQALKKKGADVNHKDKESKTPLDYYLAAQGVNVATIKALMPVDTKPEQFHEQGQSPLSPISENTLSDNAQALQDREAGVQHRDQLSNIPLPDAVVRKDEHVIDILHEADSNPEQLDEQDQLPLPLIQAPPHSNSTQVLQDGETSVQHQDQLDHIPPHHAIALEDEHAINVLPKASSATEQLIDVDAREEAHVINILPETPSTTEQLSDIDAQEEAHVINMLPEASSTTEQLSDIDAQEEAHVINMLPEAPSTTEQLSDTDAQEEAHVINMLPEASSATEPLEAGAQEEEDSITALLKAEAPLHSALVNGWGFEKIKLLTERPDFHFSFSVKNLRLLRKIIKYKNASKSIQTELVKTLKEKMQSRASYGFTFNWLIRLSIWFVSF